MNETYPRASRIVGRSEIEELMKRGKRVRASDLDAYVLPSPAAHLRTGLITPLYGQGAVKRNKLKRRLRELIRRETPRQILPLRVVIRAKKTAYDRSFVDLRDEIRELGVALLRIAERQHDV